MLEELLSDYQTLSLDLDAVKKRAGNDTERFLMDARDSLRALELEIRDKLSTAAQTTNS